MYDEKLDLYTSIVPNHRQKIIQEMKFYAFIHYNMNTFTGREWGTGHESEKLFNPKSQNTDQWCEAVKGAGMKGIILTAKHHDGFCLWQTKTCEHCIRNSPYKDGKGDIVKELSQSCKKYGLKLGLYLSPWDRNCEYYATPKYNDFYIKQLTELLTGYGEIFCLWMDGACGAAKDKKPIQKYDFDRFYSTALKLQPNIVLSNCGPDVRWVGNESGKCRKSEWNVVPAFNADQQNIANKSQTDEKEPKFKNRCTDVLSEDLGSRNVLKDYNDFMWYPAETDVSMHLGWFYHPLNSITLKSLNHLMDIYYNSVGSNTLMLLNIAPNRNGLIPKRDFKRLRQIGELIKKEDSLVIKDIEREDCDGGYTINLKFKFQSVDRIRICEDTDKSQRVESFTIFSGEKKIYEGTVIGFNKIAIFSPTQTDCLTIRINECRKEPYIKNIEVVKTGAYRAKKLFK